jgi:hypothetical protein
MALAWCPAQSLDIRVYDRADLSAQEVDRMVKVAGLVLGHAGLTVNWTLCRGVALQPEAASHCETALGQGSIAMQILAHEPASSDPTKRTLGKSNLALEGGGYSYVFVPAVRAEAKTLSVAFDLLLGYAAAHEVGHFLLGPGHSRYGLMRATWDRNDAIEMNQLRLGLTPVEARRAVQLVAAMRP